MLHSGKALTKYYMNRAGMRDADYMVQALGVLVPSMGKLVEVVVYTGVLWWADSRSDMDFRK